MTLSDFPYVLPSIEPPNQGIAAIMGSNHLQATNLGFIYQSAYPSVHGSHEQDERPAFSNPWSLPGPVTSPIPSTSSNSYHQTNSNLSQDQLVLIKNLLQEPVIERHQSNHMLHPLNPTHLLQLNPPIRDQSVRSNHHPHNPPPPLPSSQYLQTSLPPPTPPPLFDASEQDLLSSFLNIFGDSNAEYDFDPQGMPQGMPVLGELKRRLEGGIDQRMDFVEKREADEMGRQVETRLRISDPDSIYLDPTSRRTSPHSFQTTSVSFSNSADSHRHHQDLRCKKARTAHPLDLLEPITPTLPQESNASRSQELDRDVDMNAWNGDPHRYRRPPEWPGGKSVCDNSQSSQAFHYPAFGHLSEPTVEPSSFPRPLSPALRSPSASSGHPSAAWTRFDQKPSKHNSVEDLKDVDPSAMTIMTSTSSSVREPSSAKRASKSVKSTHIVSEQRRRNAIQGGFGNLVEILRAGESISGISIAIAEPSHHSNEGSSSPMNRSHGKLKPKTRGRGRRGEIETGASKSVVLERAAEFVQWMTDGNLALKNEVERIESILKSHGVQT